MVIIEDVEAFLELLDDEDLVDLLAAILDRAGISADIRIEDERAIIACGTQPRCFELEGGSSAEVVQSLLELGAFLLDEYQFVLATPNDQDLALAVVPRDRANAVIDDPRFAIIAPQARLSTPPSAVIRN
jgi:hypothetical protein